MSLFEQFFSDINKNFMYDMVSKIFLKDHNINITEDENNRLILSNKMDKIFKDNNLDDISTINKVLLDEMLNDMKQKYIKEEINNDYEKSLEKLIKERDQPIIEKSEDAENKETSVDNLFKMEEKKNETKIEEKEILPSTTINFNSNRRINGNSSRYNYIVDLKKEDINSRDLVEISKLIIPIEKNYLFSVPLLLLIIKELDISIYLQQEQLISNNNNTIGIYKPIETYRIKSKDVDRITVDIRDMTGIKYRGRDILTINIIEIKNNVLIFTCSSISKNNYKVKDMVRVLNNNTFEIRLLELLSNPLQINAIKDNMVFCLLETKEEDKVYNDIDMKIINISNQNLLVFNQSS